MPSEPVVLVVGAGRAGPGHPHRERPAAEPCEHGREERQGRDHRHQDSDRCRDSQAVEEVDADDEQAHQRDDHGGSGEEDGPTSGVDRLNRCLARLLARSQGLPVSVDDEQGVVDPHPEPDHGGQGRGEGGDVHEAGDDLAVVVGRTLPTELATQADEGQVSVNVAYVVGNSPLRIASVGCSRAP